MIHKAVSKEEWLGSSQTVACQGEGVLVTAGRAEPGAQRSALGKG